MITIATNLSYAIILIAIAIAFYRLMVGPTLADRVVALDFITLAVIGFIAVSALASRQYAYLDVAIAGGLVAFVATVAFARYVLRRADEGRGPGGPTSSGS
ncbi:MAG: monovalent cation/H+ antiporter complex subunit F [Alphaproteobacteria bacterium]